MVSLDAVQLEDLGFGPHMIPVAPIGVQIAPGSTLREKSLGKAPGKYTISGWTGIDLNDPRMRCPDYQTAKLWRDWGASIGLAAGEGLAIIDNDQGAEFSKFLGDAFVSVGVTPLRRYVKAPKHERDAWLFLVRDFIGDPVTLANRDHTFRNGVRTAKVQLLSKGKQLVVSGIHRDTKGPYVLDRQLAFDEIPTLGENQFELFWKRFVILCQDHGWKMDGSVVSPVVSRPLVPAAAHTQALVQAIAPAQLDAIIDEGRRLLEYLPNRGNLVPDANDEWLDEYENYRTVAYTLAAHLGLAAQTPQARDLFLEWAHGRAQDDDPAVMWDSIIRSPVRYGPRSFVELLKERGVLPPASFPPVDLNDPAFKLPPMPVLDRLNREWAFLTSRKGAFIRIADRLVLEPPAFDLMFQDLRGDLRKELNVKKGRHPRVSEMFCGQKDKAVFHDLINAPGEPEVLADATFNLWKPPRVPGLFNRWAPIPAATVTRAQVKPWLDHADYLLGAEALRFIKWAAFVCQCPELKPNWHYLISTTFGVGKDLLAQPIAMAVGAACEFGDISAFSSDFNEALDTKFMVISEVDKPRNDGISQQIRAKLTVALAAPPHELTINPKYQVKHKTRNRLAVLMFSNESEPMLLRRNQRRIVFVNRLHLKRKPDPYYVGLADWLRGNSELVASYLLSWALTDADKQMFQGPAPDTPDKLELEERGIEPGLKLLEELIEEHRQGDRLLVTAGALAGAITSQGVRVTTPQVSNWLRDMEHTQAGIGKGVGRVRVDPGRPGVCGVVGHNSDSARLWHLGKRAKDKREWKDIPNLELLAIWRGNPVPPSATVLAFPATVAGIQTGDEIV